MGAITLPAVGTPNSPLTPSQPSKNLELWGGVECTVNRVGDYYNDQLQWSGHKQRLFDLDRFASLGVKSLRYPVLWENVAPEGNLGAADWTWPDERLLRLRELGVRPIAGLTHHGSGPTHTNLLDPEFPGKLAEYASQVARRYPWLDAYTPVNEPLTTARFSGLYGHWYPHAKSDAAFMQALIHECRATVLVMRAIHEVNPTALLVQTEDLGKTHCTEPLQYQADFENARRWLSFDLLCGKVDEHHPLWHYLNWAGVDPAEVLWFCDNPCPPDIFGVNYYVTSERFLDHRIEKYPAHLEGGNGRDRYVDVEAVRVLAGGHDGIEALLCELHSRYDAPIAITECHLGCTREEQMRWFVEVWRSAQNLRLYGVDVRAVTAWSLLGSYDWNSLLTRADGWYESGVYEMMQGAPKPTAMVPMLQSIGGGDEPVHPVLDSPGWWRRKERLRYSPVELPAQKQLTLPTSNADQKRSDPRPILITGATGTLGKAISRQCELRGLAHVLLNRSQMDVTSKASVGQAIESVKPWAVINAAGYVRVDDAEAEPDKCFAENSEGPAIVAQECAKRGIGFLTYSSDLVFDGGSSSPYLEADRVNPLNVYGRSKVAAEQRVLEAYPNAIIARTSAFFGPRDRHNFVYHALCAIREGRTFDAVGDVTISPTYVPDLADRSLDLIIDDEHGIWHLSCEGELTWAEFGVLAAKRAGLDTALIIPKSLDDFNYRAKRPKYSVLRSHRSLPLRSVEHAVARFVDEWEYV